VNTIDNEYNIRVVLQLGLVGFLEEHSKTYSGLLVSYLNK